MNLPEFLCRDSQGRLQFKAHPVGFLDVVRVYNESFSADVVFCRYPVLPLSLIQDVIAVYLDNKAEVDALLASEPSLCGQGHRAILANPALVELRKRIEENHQSEKAHCHH